MIVDAAPFSADPTLHDTSSGSLPAELVGQSQLAAQLRESVRAAAAESACVLLVAETGTEVEAIAGCIHRLSRFAAHPFAAVSASGAEPTDFVRLIFGVTPAGVPADLEVVESGSVLGKTAGGSLLLRDADELPAVLQARFARLARDGELRTTPTEAPFRVRLMASCAPAADPQAERRRFEPDFYRRFAALRIDVPPLRQRRADIPIMVAHLTQELADAAACAPKRFTETALVLLSALDWRENLRELRALVGRLVMGVEAAAIRLEDVLACLRLEATPASPPAPGGLREARLRFEREYIAAVLQQHGWRVGEAARTLGIQRPNLYRKVRQLGIAVLKPNLPSSSR
jgi:DNA-binding NtrC family response regulator